MSAQDLRDEVLLATQSLNILAELAQDAQDVQRPGRHPPRYPMRGRQPGAVSRPGRGHSMSAQVFHHPNHAASPVLQMPRKAWLKRYEASLRDRSIQTKTAEIESIEEVIDLMQKTLATKRQELAEMLCRYSQQNQA